MESTAGVPAQQSLCAQDDLSPDANVYLHFHISLIYDSVSHLAKIGSTFLAIKHFHEMHSLHGQTTVKGEVPGCINHQPDLNGAELIYTCSGPASKPLKHKICPFPFPLSFKPLHFYYPLKGTLKCLLVKRIKYLQLRLIPWSLAVIASVAGVILLPTPEPGPAQRHQWMSRGAAQGHSQHRSCWDVPKESILVEIYQTLFLPLIEGLRVHGCIKKLGNDWNF